MTKDKSRRFWNQIIHFISLLLGLWLLWDLLSHLVAEILWFQEVGYLPAFLKRLQVQLGLWIVACSISAAFLFGNLFLANQLKYFKESLDSEIQVFQSTVRRPSAGTINSIGRTSVKTIRRPTPNAPQPSAS